MKTLYIIRHGKSSWKDISLDDIGMPLNKRGKGDIEIIWQKLKEMSIFPDIIISSTAKRARKTIEKICEYIWYSEDKIVFDKWIYDNHISWIKFYIWLIKWIKNTKEKVFLVWHNSAWNELSDYLLQEDIWNIPTSWVLAIEFDINNWKDISPWKWKLKYFLKPR